MRRAKARIAERGQRIALIAVLLLSSGTARAAALDVCKQYQFQLLDNMVEAYEGKTDPAEVAAHVDVVTWNALFLIAQCPLESASHLLPRRNTVRKWITEIPHVLSAQALSSRQRELLAVTADHLGKVAPGGPPGDLLREVARSLVSIAPSFGARQPPAATETELWCRTMPELVEAQWRQPDGYLMAAVNNTTIMLSSCPAIVFSSLVAHPLTFELWIGNLSTAVFPSDAELTRSDCELARDLLSALESLKNRPQLAEPVRKALDEITEDTQRCSGNRKARKARGHP